MTFALELLDISRRFGNVVALREAQLRVRAGTVHAVLGENGAGKTTLMRVAFGLVAADSGRMLRAGRPLVVRNPTDALQAGIGMVHQHFTLVPAMTVAENVALGMPGRFSARQARDRVVELGNSTGLPVAPDDRVEALPVGAQQRVEILKAVARDVEVLVLDEPTAVLAPDEVEELLAWIRRFATGNRAVVLITHKLREALSVADDVTVLRGGRSVYHSAANDTSQDMLLTAMLGSTPAKTPAPPAEAPPGSPVVLQLRGVNVRAATGPGLHDVSLSVRAGELLGIAAVEGSGQAELLRMLAGRLNADSGTVDRPPECAFIAEDRHRDGAVLDFTLAENVALRGLGRARGLLDWDATERRTTSLMNAFDVRAPGAATPIAALSGGNQQKLILARELEPLPPAVVAENPTRGLDVQATSEVHRRLRAAAGAGAAVVLYSSDVDEVLELASRVIVMHNGRLIQVPNDRVTVGRAMLGAST